MINYGIIGCGNIAKRVAIGINSAKDSFLYAFASRNVEKAKSYSEEFKSNKYYGNYDDLLSDSNVDIVYICTPNAFHFEQIKMCLNHHKNVICEKPMVATIKQLDEIYSLAKENNCFLMEAHKTCFTPLNKILKKRVQDNEFGKLKKIEADYSFNIMETYEENSNHWVLNDYFGGASYDIGVYPLCLANFYANSCIKEFKVETLRNDDYLADFGFNANIKYENGVEAVAKTSWFKTSKDKGSAILTLDKATIIIPAFWKSNRATIIKEDGKVENVEVEMSSDFTGEIEEATNCLNNHLIQSPLMNYDASKEILKILEKVNDYRK